MVNNDNTHLTAFSQDHLGKPIHQKGKAILDSNDARDNGVWGWQWHWLYQTANCVKTFHGSASEWLANWLVFTAYSK